MTLAVLNELEEDILCLALTRNKCRILELLFACKAGDGVFNKTIQKVLTLSPSALQADVILSLVSLTSEAILYHHQSDESTLLYIAAGIGSTTVTERVLRYAPAMIDAKNATGHTPLLVACQHGHKQVVKLLLKARPNLLFQTKALHEAARSRKKTLVEMIFNTNPSLIAHADENQKLPLYYAAQTNHLCKTRRSLWTLY